MRRLSCAGACTRKTPFVQCEFAYNNEKKIGAEWKESLARLCTAHSQHGCGLIARVLVVDRCGGIIGTT